MVSPTHVSDDDDEDEQVKEQELIKMYEKKEGTPAAASSSDSAEDLPGTKTQDQEAADPKKAGESVAD